MLERPEGGFSNRLNKLLALSYITKLNSSMDDELSCCFDAAVLEALRRHFCTTVFGNPSRLANTVVLELKDLANDFRDDDDQQKLKDGIYAISMKLEGPSRRTVQAVLNLLDKMALKKKVINEKRLKTFWSQCGAPCSRKTNAMIHANSTMSCFLLLTLQQLVILTMLLKL
ncbi:hypothetical protein BD560DRAFT_55947 [Blakeslea trispora]|nr:hypothetical protein BD560DRAFT_55947 [Blakeslea trispora]